MKRETLAICGAHKQDNPNINYIIELYENDVKNHINSPQFKKFTEVAKTAIKFIKKQGTTAIVPHIKFHLNFIKN
ncbi:hypothetical protein AB6N29_08710 [Fusobacterium animalis]|uniref:hypothetical protein n=1 Tax=Fusobacterium TaxID=848 RepID=UPI0001B8F1B2|nr:MULTISPECIES: hypothetical protein [Fusobacterium]EEW94630.1 hypothetical protein HMPREF0406_01430 [Fusobacterium animalis 3_1_33]MCG6844861.1 hypothetical protein [Fusobacterium nucleatum]